MTLTAVRSLNALRTYVEQGELQKDLAELDVEAAVNALAKSDHASDRASQVWSAINHLESAEAKYYKLFRNRVIVGAMYSRAMRDEYWTGLIKSKLFMAACYLYLEERALCRAALDSIESVVVEKQKMKRTEQIAHLVGFFMPPRPKDWMSDFRTDMAWHLIDWDREIKPLVVGLRSLATESRPSA